MSTHSARVSSANVVQAQTHPAVGELIRRYRLAAYHEPSRDITLTKLQDLVMSVTGLRPNEIRSQRRSMQFVKARLTLYWLARRFTNRSFPEIAHFLGHRDHTTVFQGAKRVQYIVDTQLPEQKHDNPELWLKAILAVDWPPGTQRRPDGRYERVRS